MDNLDFNQILNFLFSMWKDKSLHIFIFSSFGVAISICSLAIAFVHLESNKTSRKSLESSAKMMFITIILLVIVAIVPHKNLYISRPLVIGIDNIIQIRYFISSVILIAIFSSLAIKL